MAINFDFNENNKKITERKENTPAKKIMDNSSSVLYNKIKENSGILTPVTDLANKWKDKNQGALKYAGDSAKKSINAGLDEAPSYMQDADEGTSFEDVQTASVKRSLASDANDSKLYNLAVHEIIGHLSKENKEPYLKNAEPLETYIDAKDKFDFKNNNYTTTENVDKTPNENVRQLQRDLNKKGYTDKFGQKLKEDGIYGGKTAYALDKFDEDNSEDYNVVALNKNGEPFESAHFVSATPVYDVQAITDWKNGDNMKVASVTGTGGKGVLEAIDPDYYPGKYDGNLSDKGNLSVEDKKYNKTKQTMIKCLSANWYGSKNNKTYQDYIHTIADKLRTYDDNSFNTAILLNKSDGASGAGHNAIMLLNKDNEGLIFSFYSTNSNIPNTFYTDAEMRFGILSADEVENLLHGENKNTLFLVASDNSVQMETYDRYICFDLPNGGYNIYNAAVGFYDCPGKYRLIGRNCDDIAVELLKESGVNINQSLLPNWTYDDN